MPNKRYWHKEVTSAELMKMAKANPNMTWKEVVAKYSQPDWCEYPGALSGEWGCWPLIDSQVKDKDDCSGCECLGEDKEK